MEEDPQACAASHCALREAGLRNVTKAEMAAGKSYLVFAFWNKGRWETLLDCQVEQPRENPAVQRAFVLLDSLFPRP